MELGRQVEDVWGQLTQWAQAVDNLEQVLSAEKNKPPIFKKLTFKDDAAEAMAMLEAEQKLKTMRAQLRERFLYGDLYYLGGMDALKRFYELQRQLRQRRIRMLQEQRARRQALIENLVQAGLIGAVLLFGGWLLWVMVSLILPQSKSATVQPSIGVNVNEKP